MNSKWRSLPFATVLAVVSMLVVLSLPPSASAIPAFSRRYGTSCTTCHSDFPKLNDFGKAFKDAGFKFPKDDESFLKAPPVLLGAPAQAELWPHTVYPGSIPGLLPVGLRYNTYYQQVSANRNNFNLALPAGTVGNFIPKSDFQPGYFSIFTAGNFGTGISWWVDDDISVAGANANGALGDAYLKFNDLSRFLKLPKDSLNLRAGQFELDLPFSQARTWNLSGWDIFSEANVGIQNGLGPQQFVNNGSALEDAANGIEFSGGHIYQGYHYSVAVFDQNTTGLTISPPNVAPQNAVAFNSDANFKDLYGRFVYRFNLEKDPVSRDDVQAAGAMGPRDHTFLALGAFYLYGRTAQPLSGVLADGVTPTVLTAREPFYRIGGDVNFNYRTFNVFGVYLAAHDHNLLPVTAPGAAGVTGFTPGAAATFSGGFAEADYLALPWAMTIMRWDQVKSSADRINFIQYDPTAPPGSSFFSPYSATRNRFTPGEQFLIHANIKTSIEYQIMPKQIVYNPATGLPHTGPFRTNALIVGLEFAY
jgi:hypothetical protein